VKIELTDYQETAAAKLVAQARGATDTAEETKHAFVLTAPTGSGKTAIVTAVMERLLAGDDARNGDPDCTFLWVTDAPELNEQSKKKILTTSEVFSPARIETIESGFDRPTFDTGKIYFLNTQKLGRATTFTQSQTDQRTYSLWDTISRTAAERPRNFFLVLDEAHKGVGRRAGAEVAEVGTIVERLIVGGGGLVSPALLLGMSATPARFNELLDRVTDRLRWPLAEVSAEDVRESGLLKDEIVLWHTRKNGKSDWALLREAAQALKRYEQEWVAFCKREAIDAVKPILVVQVTDGTGKKASNTNLSTAVQEIEGVLGAVRADAVAHCFEDAGRVEFAPDRFLRKVAPSDIQDDPDVRVVFFKMALNTGWDCPRAEVMMSFRRAVDHTHIAQLVGRMVRTPLARRVVSEDALNSVALYLPNWDEAALKQVIEHLTSSDDAIPSTIERGEDLATYSRARRTKALFEEAAGLPTYPSQRVNRASNVKRLMQLARYLSNDGVDPQALAKAKKLVLGTLETNRKRLGTRLRRLGTAVQKADLVAITVEIGAPTDKEPEQATIGRSIQLAEQNVRDLFADAGRRLGAGLHLDYVAARTSASRPPSVTAARAELCVLADDKQTLDELEKVTGQTIKAWWQKHHSARLALSPERQADYSRVNRMAAAPEADMLALPAKFTARKGPKTWEKHLYVDSDDLYAPSPQLSGWEELTLKAELRRPGFKRWLRNPPRKEWSLGIPYDSGGVPAMMYPDFLVFRSEGSSGVICDLLEPHAPNQEDLAPKLGGLCRFAAEHGGRFGRIELIIVEGRKGKEHLLRVNVNDPDVREEARLLDTAPQIVALARRLASD
jgi:type III restriction enzyme